MRNAASLKLPKGPSDAPLYNSMGPLLYILHVSFYASGAYFYCCGKITRKHFMPRCMLPSFGSGGNRKFQFGTFFDPTSIVDFQNWNASYSTN